MEIYGQVDRNEIPRHAAVLQVLTAAVNGKYDTTINKILRLFDHFFGRLYNFRILDNNEVNYIKLASIPQCLLDDPDYRGGQTMFHIYDRYCGRDRFKITKLDPYGSVRLEFNFASD
jgi:hypothetical protein